MSGQSQDPNWHWDGHGWWHWDGVRWVAHDAAQPAQHESTVQSSNRTPVILGVVGALLLVAIGAGIVLLVKKDGGGESASEATTIRTEPVSSATDPFTPPGEVGEDEAVTPVQSDSAVTVEGGHAGLYGGTMKKTQCDPEKLVRFLESHPDKGSAWAGVVGIGRTEIRSYVKTLTSVVLRSDTLVTNHGYVNGHATTVVAVLEAGTAVLVNDRGLPVVKCYCGNPLTAAPPKPGPVTYSGPTWPGWRPGVVTVVNVNTTVINDFTLINIINNKPFTRPAGSNGSEDTPTTMPTPTPTASGSATPTPTASGTGGQEEEAYELVRVAAAKCAAALGGGAFTELDTHPEKYKIKTKPTGTPGMYRVEIQELGSDGGVYAWTVNVPARTMVPANEGAAGVVQYCPGMDNG